MHPPTATGTTEVLALAERLKQAIWKKRPILGEIMQKHGAKVLSKYSKDFMDVNKAPGLDERKPELIKVVEELVTGRLGAEVGKGVARQLTKLPLVSTADHHTINQHPFFLNEGIISGIPLYEDPDPDVQYLIAFSFASVSVNNLSGFARGILFNGGMDGSANLIKLPVITDKFKMSVVYSCKPYTREDLTKAEGELLKKEKEQSILPGKGEKVRALMEEFLGRDDVLSASNLCSQITRINYRYWPRLFHGPTQQARKTPDLIYLDIETIVAQTLLRHHLTHKTLVHRFIFDPALWPLVLRHFDGIPGAFSKANDWGTFLFWGLDEKVRRVRLHLDGNRLVSRDGTIDIPLTPAGIEKALREKKIFPSMLTCYLMVCFYYGMKCLGGFCQVHDLTLCKEAWGAMLREMGENAEAEAIVPVQTKELGGDGLVLSYIKTAAGNIVPAMGFDMLLEEDDTSFERYVELSQRVTLQEMMDPMLPDMYVVLYPEPQRDPELSKLKTEDIFQATGLAEKLPAV